MARSGLGRLLTLLLVILTANLPILGNAQGALLQATGDVRVNGNTVEKSAAVLKGDVLETGANSVASLTATGTSILLLAQSSVVYEGELLEVFCGTAIISTSGGMGARAGNLTAVPTSASAKFDVVHSVDGIGVAAREGSLEVNDGERQVTLRPGESMTGKGGCLAGSAMKAQTTTAAPPQVEANVPQNRLSGKAIAGITIAAAVATILIGLCVAEAGLCEEESPVAP